MNEVPFVEPESLDSAPTTRRALVYLIPYLRLSREEAHREHHGLDAQLATVTRAADAHGWELAAPARDVGRSGKSLRGRDALAAALVAVEAGEADGIVVSRLDRLSRSVHDFAGLVCRAEEHGWVLVVLDLGLDLSTPQGRMIGHVLCSMAELERELISQRTRDALAAARAKGVRLGRPRAVPEAVVDQILDMRTGAQSYRAIAEALTRAGVPSPTGLASWQASTVRRICDAETRTVA